MKTTCIMCPVSCQLNIERKNGKIVVSGNACPRGIIYGEREMTRPQRIVTTIKKYRNGTISLKTDNPIDKHLVDDCLREIKQASVPNKIEKGEILIENILNTNVNIVVTGINQ